MYFPFSTLRKKPILTFLLIITCYIQLGLSQRSSNYFKKEFRHHIFENSHSEVFLRKDVLKICTKFTGQHPCRSAISTKLQSNFIEITLRHGYSPVNLLHIFRTPFPKNTSEGLLLKITKKFLNINHENHISVCLFPFSR